MIRRSSAGSFKRTESFFKNAAQSKKIYRRIMNEYGSEGVKALQQTVPVDTGKTRDGMAYSVRENGLYFFNTNDVPGKVPISILLQYGYATRHGGYVPGRDYVNPALQPVFDKITAKYIMEISQL